MSRVPMDITDVIQPFTLPFLLAPYICCLNYSVIELTAFLTLDKHFVETTRNLSYLPHVTKRGHSSSFTRYSSLMDPFFGIILLVYSLKSTGGDIPTQSETKLSTRSDDNQQITYRRLSTDKNPGIIVPYLLLHVVF